MATETARDQRARHRDEVRQALLSPERDNTHQVRLARASRLAMQGVSSQWAFSTDELSALRALRAALQTEQPAEEGGSLPPVSSTRLETGLQALENQHQRVIEALLAMNSGCNRTTLILTLGMLLTADMEEGALHLLQPYWPDPVVHATPTPTRETARRTTTPRSPPPAFNLSPGRNSFSGAPGLMSLSSEARAPASHPTWPGEKVSVLNLSWTPTTKMKAQTYNAQQLEKLELVYKGEGQSVLTWWTRVREQASLNRWSSVDALNHIIAYFLKSDIKLAYNLDQQTKAVPAEGEEFIPELHKITKITDAIHWLRARYEKREDLLRPYHLFFSLKQKGGERLRDFYHRLQILQNEVQRNDIEQVITLTQLRMQVFEGSLPSIKAELQMRQAGRSELSLDEMLDIGDVMFRNWSSKQELIRSRTKQNPQQRRRSVAMNQQSSGRHNTKPKKLSEAELTAFCKKLKDKYGTAHGKYIGGDERVTLQRNDCCFICFSPKCSTRDCPQRQKHLQAIERNKRKAAMESREEESNKKSKSAKAGTPSKQTKFRDELEREHPDEDDMNEFHVHHTAADMLNGCENTGDMETHHYAAATDGAELEVDDCMNEQTILGNTSADDQDYTNHHSVEAQDPSAADGPIFQ